MMGSIDDFFIADGGILYTPPDWYDRQGWPRYPAEQFILVSKIKGGQSLPGYDGKGSTGYAVPLNGPNLEDIFAKLPEMTSEHHVWKGIVARLIELELRGRIMRNAESLKLNAGMQEEIVWVDGEKKVYFFKDDETGEGYGPFYTRPERRITWEQQAQLLDLDTYSPPGRKFYYQQRAAISMMDYVPKALLAMEQRVGKTPTLVTAARVKHERGLVKLTVVVSTRRLLYTAWTDDLTMYWPDAGFTILGSDKAREDFTENHYDVAMTSFESLYKNWPLIRRLYDPSEVMIVADETIKIKSPEARRTTAMLAACSEAGYCYLLSGAPVSRLHSDLFPQLMCVDPGLFGLNYSTAMDFFFQFQGDGSMRFRRDRKHLFHQIADLGVWRCTRGEAEQFKGKETSTVNIRLKFDPLQARLYRDLADYMYATLVNDEMSASVKATNILVQLGRLREICSGFLSYEWAPGKYLRIRLPYNPKIDWIREYFTDNDGSKAVLFCEYNETEEMVADLLDEMKISWGGQLKVKRERAAGIRHGNPDHHFKKHMDEFQACERQVFLGKHSSIGHGLTLNAAEVEIFVEMGFNSDNYDQARMRAVGGDTGHILVYHLLMGGSLEETKIYKALSKRQNMKAAVLKDLERTGYASFFEEISMADLLIDDTYRSESIDDMLEVKARKILGYDGPVEIEALTEWATSMGHGLFARIKRSIGSMGSLKQAFKAIAINFHPDKAVAAGHEKGSPMYMLHEKIFKDAVEARAKAWSLGDFVQRIGGKELAPDWQMWYDYMVRKAHTVVRETREPIVEPERLLGQHPGGTRSELSGSSTLSQGG